MMMIFYGDLFSTSFFPLGYAIAPRETSMMIFTLLFRSVSFWENAVTFSFDKQVNNRLRTMPNVFLFVKNLRHVKEVVMLLRVGTLIPHHSCFLFFSVIILPLAIDINDKKDNLCPQISKWRRHKQQAELLQLMLGFYYAADTSKQP